MVVVKGGIIQWLLSGSKSLGGVSWGAIVWGGVVQEEVVIEPILNTIRLDFEFVIEKLYSKQIVKTRYYSYQVFLFFFTYLGCFVPVLRCTSFCVCKSDILWEGGGTK